MQMGQSSENQAQENDSMVEAIAAVKARYKEAAIFGAIMAASEIGKGGSLVSIIILATIGAIVGWIIGAFIKPSQRKPLPEQYKPITTTAEITLAATLLGALATGHTWTASIGIALAAMAAAGLIAWAIVAIKQRYQ